MLVFRTRRLSGEEWGRVTSIADYIGTDKATGLRLFRLNPAKAARLGVEETRVILAELGVAAPRSILDKIGELEKLRVDLYVDWAEEDLALYTWSRGLGEELRRTGLARWYRGMLRARPSDLASIMRLTARRGYRVNTGFRLNYKLGFDPGRPKTPLRPYQEEALGKWVENGFRGVIGLPTGSGKTLIAVHALSRLKVKTLILVPTIDLLAQWADTIRSQLNIPPGGLGTYGGGSRTLAPITVMTYDSAVNAATGIRETYGLIVADECHHAVSQTYRRVLEKLTAPYRMGLSATPWRQDGLHQHYPGILGEIVYWRRPSELQEEGYLARHREKRIYVSLSPEEREEYERLMGKYREYCERRVPWIKDPLKQFEAVLRLAARDSEAREALRARSRARRIALSTPAKLRVILELLEKHRGDKIIIFSRYTDIVREVARKLLVPLILHDTGREERRRILRYFREGKVRIIATAMALDEGVDVPDASVAIIISGTGSSREYVQRLGRILRPKEKEAVLYEILTKETLDVSLARRRRRLGDVR